MKINPVTSALGLALALSLCLCAVAQESAYERFRGHNAEMRELQPTWMGPLIQSDARIGQGLKLSFSNSNFPPVQPLIVGNNKGFSVIAARRFQLDFDPPSYFKNRSAKYPDGFGNAGTQVKYRIVSGNAGHGNFAVTAILFHGFGARASQNQMQSAYYIPSIAAGKAFGRFATLTTVGGVLPTAKIGAQGRVVEWNLTEQFHVTRNAYFDIENNANFFRGGSDDGLMQNFMTPAAFYALRRKDWRPEHASLVLDCGMQIATSTFHVLNHNLVTEMRVVF